MNTNISPSKTMAAKPEQSSFSQSDCAVEGPCQDTPNLSPSKKCEHSLSISSNSSSLSPHHDEKPAGSPENNHLIECLSWTEMELQFSEQVGMEYSWPDLKPGIQILLEKFAWKDILSKIKSILEVAIKPGVERRKGKMRNFFARGGGLRGNWRFLQPQFSFLSQQHRGNNNGCSKRKAAQLSRQANHGARHMEADIKQNQLAIPKVAQSVGEPRISRSTSARFECLHPGKDPVYQRKTSRPQDSERGTQSQVGMFDQISTGSDIFTEIEVMRNNISSPWPTTQLLPQIASELCRNQAEKHKSKSSSSVDIISCILKASPEVRASQELSSTIHEFQYQHVDTFGRNDVEKKTSDMRAAEKEESLTGGDWESDEKLLTILRGLNEEIKVSASMARKHCSINRHVTALEIPCVYNEDVNFPPLPSSSPFLELFRELLGVPEGIRLRDKLTCYSMESCEIRVWVSAMISSLVQKFAFGSGIPFDIESEEILRGMFEKQGKSNEYIDSMLHHHRVETLNLMSKPGGPNNVSFFATRLKKLRDNFVVKLNETLFPLVGGSPKTQNHHRKIAMAAEQLLLVTSAYNGAFTASSLRIHESIDFADYELAFPPDADSQRFEGEPCLATIMMAVHFTRPGYPPRVLAYGKVQHFPLTGSDEPPNKHQRLGV